MSVKKLFWADPYLTEVVATVTSVQGNQVTLDQTIAYARSGGQDSDSGTIGGFEILAAEKQGREIVYALPPGHGLSLGDRVTVAIDWEKRYRLMRLHFAAELVLELMYQRYQRPEKIGANIRAEKARLDFRWQGNISEAFPFLEAQLAQLVQGDFTIISEAFDEAGEKRFWAIEGFAKVPCGGTHLKRTGEIGTVRLKRNNIGRGKERIEITLV